MSAEVSTVTISGAYRSTIGGMSVVYHSIVKRESTDTICRSIDRYLILSTDVSTNASADISTDTRGLSTGLVSVEC